MFCLEELHEAEGGGRRSWRGSRLGKRWQLWREGGYLYGCKRTGLLYILIDDLTSLNQTFLVSVSKVRKSPSLFHANSDKVGIFGDSSPFFQIHLCLICKVCWWAYDHILQVHQPRVRPPLEGISWNLLQSRFKKKLLEITCGSKTRQWLGWRHHLKCAHKLDNFSWTPKDLWRKGAYQHISH